MKDAVIPGELGRRAYDEVGVVRRARRVDRADHICVREVRVHHKDPTSVYRVGLSELLKGRGDRGALADVGQIVVGDLELYAFLCQQHCRDQDLVLFTVVVSSSYGGQACVDD